MPHAPARSARSRIAFRLRRHASGMTGEALAFKDIARNVRGMGKLLIVAGLVLVAIGIVWLVGERMGLGRLPGDIVIERENMRFYFPLMSSLIVSVVLSLALWLFMR